MNFWSFLLIALIATASLVVEAGAQKAKPDLPQAEVVPSITQIIVQRTRCYGHCPIDRLELNADGTAIYSGEAYVQRVGHYLSTFKEKDFSRLAAWIEQHGFFDLKDEIGRANIDSSDLIICVCKDRLFKTVVFHRINSSLLVWPLETMIRGVAAEFNWQKDEIASTSGVRGTTLRPLTEAERARIQNRVTETVAMRFVNVYVSGSVKGKAGNVTSCVADKEGRFQIMLPPGKYQISAATDYQNHWRTTGQTVIVEVGKFSDITIRYESDAAPKP